MSTLARIITASIVALLMTSCNFDINFGPGVEGNGDVITQDRNISGEFNKIAATRGIEVLLIQSDDISVKVEADSNLHDIISTEFDAERKFLKISTEANIKSSSTKKVYVSVPNLQSISTTSGAYLSYDDTFTSNKLTIASTSGSHVELDVNSKSLTCKSTSGAGIKVTGNSDNLSVSATSGSYINAKNLEAKVSKASVTSGANISVNTSDKLTANATSGGSIRYSGNPENVNKNKAVSGSISKI